jgi:hypothetical protein
MKSRFILFLKVATPVVLGFLIAYVLVLRPWHHHWGATDSEVHAILPGDNLIAATSQITHAITINTPADKVWPWLMQIGQDRSGFYSYTPLENAFGCEMPKVEELKSEWRPRTKGEIVWFCAPRRFKGQGYMVAAVVDPGKAFVMVSGPDWTTLQNGNRAAGGSWGFILEPVDANHTRLIARLRGGTPPSVAGRIIGAAFWDPAHFAMERKMLTTIKRLAETTS